MTASVVWGLLTNPLTNIGLGLLLAVGAFALLREYRELFMKDPRAVMSVEVLMAVISRGSGPGYFAAFLLAGAILNLVWGLYVLITRLPYVIG